ncbi:hypothetical protein EZS27_030878, partial [termite gut metagenome]
KRNQVITLKGEFLTKDMDGGSVGIDDHFTEEIIVPI